MKICIVPVYYQSSRKAIFKLINDLIFNNVKLYSKYCLKVAYKLYRITELREQHKS